MASVNTMRFKSQCSVWLYRSSSRASSFCLYSLWSKRMDLSRYKKKMDSQNLRSLDSSTAAFNFCRSAFTLCLFWFIGKPRIPAASSAQISSRHWSCGVIQSTALQLWSTLTEKKNLMTLLTQIPNSSRTSPIFSFCSNISA